MFDGVYRKSEVWINGHYLGIRLYGYSSFYYDLTQHLSPVGRENVIAVKVNTTQQPNSRWYNHDGGPLGAAVLMKRINAGWKF